MAAKPRVLVSVSYGAHEYQHMQVEEARAAGERFGFEITAVDCNRDAGVQVRQLEAALRAPEGRPVAMVVLPQATAALETVARAALDQGVGWVMVEQTFYMERLRAAHPGKLVAMVNTDDRQLGRLQAQIFRTLLPRGGNVVYAEGPSLTPAVMQRRQGVDEGLRGSTVQVAKTLVADWSEAGAERVATAWLQSGRATRPAAVGGQNETLALGVRKALQAIRPEWADIPYVGCDGTATGQRLVRDKVLVATVVQPPTMGKAVELVARALRGAPVPLLTLTQPTTFPAIDQLGPVQA